MPAAIGDFNGDGLPDIALIPRTQANIHFYINIGKKAN